MALHLDVRDIAGRLGHRVHSICVAQFFALASGGQDPDLCRILLGSAPGPEVCERFDRQYGSALRCFDGFVVDHPIWHAALFEKLDKPVVANVTTRYDLGVTESRALWAWLDATLRRMHDRGQLIPMSNNRADRAYTREMIGFDWPMVPSLCEYPAIPYVGDRPEWLLSALDHPPLPQPYAWSELGRYRGIRHVPYNTSLMSVTEQYAAAIPLAMPSEDRLFRMALDDEMGAMGRVSLLKCHGLPPGTGWNDYRSADVLRRWIALCDWYDDEWMPHVTILDEPPATARLDTLDPQDISRRVASFNVGRRRRILQAWQATLARLEAPPG